ncbi:MAG: LysM peptidoglycan-binding domain-containing protein [Eubacterium sp.]|nr:LysM peptidoglycan-binding domain-containing protein [Candidatus Colimonas fimequi]
MERVTPERNTQNYTVKAGDTLASIARRLTGSADYSAIYEQNKDLIGSNPNNITAGLVLLIPGTGTSDDEW